MMTMRPVVIIQFVRVIQLVTEEAKTHRGSLTLDPELFKATTSDQQVVFLAPWRLGNAWGDSEHHTERGALRAFCE